MSKLRRLASRVGLEFRYWSRRLVRPGVISCGGVRLPVRFTRCSAAIVDELYRETYECYEAEIVRATLSPGETVLELGAGIGFIATVCARLKASVYCIEANPCLIPIAERTFQLNGVLPSLRHAAVGRSNGTIELLVDHEFWRSSTVGGVDMPARRVEVPVVRLNDLLKEIRPSFLICDIEAAEFHVLDDADLSCVRKLVVEVHPKLGGWDSVRRLIRSLFDAGFPLDTMVSRGNVLMFRRED